MAEKRVTEMENGGNGGEVKYLTRYSRGLPICAEDAALDLLDRARFRVAFLGTLFDACKENGITIPDYEVCGLAYILEDVGYDIQTAYNYFYGDDPTPGKEYGYPEVKS